MARDQFLFDWLTMPRNAALKISEAGTCNYTMTKEVPEDFCYTHRSYRGSDGRLCYYAENRASVAKKRAARDPLLLLDENVSYIPREDRSWSSGAHVTLSFPEVDTEHMKPLYFAAIEAGIPFRMYVEHPTTET